MWNFWEKASVKATELHQAKLSNLSVTNIYKRTQLESKGAGN